MRMAEQAGAATFLVADIDRGGVFGSVYGTIALLKPEERVLMKGIIINKFRGDASLFDDGRKIIEDLTGVPVVGVIPWFRDIKIEEEDSVALDMKHNTYRDGKINVAIILLKRMSNFTDFDVLDMDPRFNAYYTNNIDEIEKADIILLPGSKNTLSDLQSLRACGIADAIIRAHKNGKKVIGICGGYQMMGARLEDPKAIEGNLPAVPGLGLLPQCTIIEPEKITRQSTFAFLPGLCKDGSCKDVREPSPTAVAATRYTWDEQLCLATLQKIRWPSSTTDGRTVIIWITHAGAAICTEYWITRKSWTTWPKDLIKKQQTTLSTMQHSKKNNTTSWRI